MGSFDQWYLPDILYISFSEEAMIYEINQLKHLGFNSIKKHIKIELFRYYYHCDKIEILIWKEMPAGNIDEKRAWNKNGINGGADAEKNPGIKILLL